MHTVYINDKPLIFENVYSEKLNILPGYSVLSESEFPVEVILEKIADKNIDGIIYLCAQPDKVWNNFTDRFILIEAAGGLVINEKEECLVIFRKKVWDLPKGKLDYSESPENAAVREVMEECGIKKLKLNKPLIKTFHTYSEKNKFILKKTHWFTMSASSDEKLVPEKGEDIEKAVWMDEKKINSEVIPHTYNSIRDVFNSYFKGI